MKNNLYIEQINNTETLENEYITNLNHASGNWAPMLTKSVGSYPVGVAVGDANNDGYNDIVACNNVHNTINDWNPEFKRTIRLYPTGVFIGDSNNDGFNDIVTCNSNDDTLSIILWNNTISDWEPQILISIGRSPQSVSIGDVNNDGFNDVVTSNRNDNDISIIFWNNNTGDWNSTISKSTGNSPETIFIGDANNDGYNDMITANWLANTTSIHLWNNTVKDWDPEVIKSVGYGPEDVFIGDSNNDGYNDIIVTNAVDDNISIFLWNSTIIDWEPQITKSAGNGPLSVFIGDANNDGYNDIITTNTYDDNMSILLWNNTIIDWEPQTTISTGDHPSDVSIADANNDGYNDIVLLNENDDEVAIFLWEEEIMYLNLTTPENKSYSTPMTGYYPATFGFENDEDGQDPKSWVIDAESTIIEVIPELYNHKKVLRLGDFSTVDPSRVHNSFSSKDNGTVESWILLDYLGTDGRRGQISGRGNDNQIILVKMVGGSPSKWQVRDNGTDIDIVGAPTPFTNTWYHVRIDFEHTTGGYQGLGKNEYFVYIDGVQYGPYLFSFDEPLDELHLHTYSYGVSYDAYFDAVGYSWDANYNIGDNLKEGLLISYETNINLDWEAFSLDYQQNTTINGNYTIPFPEDGIHNIQLFGNDSSGNNYESDLIYFSIDTSPPEITIKSPSDSEFFGVSAPDFDLSINELNINSTWYTIDNGNINITFNGLSGTINQTEWGKKGNEPVTIRFYANDSFGFESYAEVMINKDIDPPSSIISFTPHSGTNIVNRSTNFTLTSDDGSGSGVLMRWYKINDSVWMEYTNPFSLSAYSAGDYLISYYSIDEVGNEETEYSILVNLEDTPSESTPSSVIPGYNILIIIGTISLIIFVFYKKKYK